MRVAILGSGPSAAFAVAACKELEIYPIVYSYKPWNTDLKGATWVSGIPDSYLRDPDMIRKYRVVHMMPLYSNADIYNKAMWGDAITETSYPLKPEVKSAYHPSVLLTMIGSASVGHIYCKFKDDDIKRLSDEYDLVIQTFSTEEEISKQPKLLPIYIYEEDVPDRGVNLAIYAGEPWLRMSILWNKIFWEYAHPIEGYRQYPTIARKIPPDCPTILEGVAPNVLRVGRYATWERKAFSYHSYLQVRYRLEQMLNG